MQGKSGNGLLVHEIVATRENILSKNKSNANLSKPDQQKTAKQKTSITENFAQNLDFSNTSNEIDFINFRQSVQEQTGKQKTMVEVNLCLNVDFPMSSQTLPTSLKSDILLRSNPQNKKKTSVWLWKNIAHSQIFKIAIKFDIPFSNNPVFAKIL